MSEDTPTPTPKAGTIAGFDPAEYISKFGLPTVILLVVGYVGYNEVLHPIAERYAQLLEEVKNNNSEIKAGLFTIGETNQARIQKIEDAILKNSTVVAQSIESVAEKNEAQLETVLREIDNIKDKLEDILQLAQPDRGSYGSSQETQQETEGSG